MAPIAPTAAADRTLVAIICSFQQFRSNEEFKSSPNQVDVWSSARGLGAQGSPNRAGLFALTMPHVHTSGPNVREVDCGNVTVTYGAHPTGRLRAPHHEGRTADYLPRSFGP